MSPFSRLNVSDVKLKIPLTPEMLHIARRMVWFQKPEEALKHPYTFMAHVMTYGTVEDIIVVK